MFDHIVLRRSPQNPAFSLSLGEIAESMLYYQKVQLILNRESLFALLKTLGSRGTMTLLRRPEISAVYSDEFLGTYTQAHGVTEFHGFICGMLAGDEKHKLDTPAARLHFELVRNHILSKSEASKFVDRFFARVPRRGLDGNHYAKGGITSSARADILNQDFLKAAVSDVVSRSANGYNLGDTLEIELINTTQGFCVFSNIDFERINASRSKENALKMANLLTPILEAKADLILASYYGGDFVTSPQSSSLIGLYHADALKRTNLNEEARQSFSEIVLPDMPALAEVIDSGERSFDEFIKLLDKSDRFKGWLKAVNPDEGLVRSYMLDVSKEARIQGQPAKTLRYFSSLTIDAIASKGTSLAAGFVDNFLLDKLLSGWRPNHFVSNRLIPFLNRCSQ